MISSLSVPEQHSESDGSTHLPPRRTRRRWRQYKSATPRTKDPRIWVQLGCTKTSREFLRAPRVAIGAVKLQTVTSGRCTVTAEVASSSLVVPAIHSKRVRLILLKPLRTRNGAFAPFSCPYLSGYVQQFPVRQEVTLHAHRKKRPATRPLLALHASPE